MTKRNVLFLCTGNSCRSQMAEGLTNFFLGDRYQAFSAGTAPSGYVHPLAVQVIAELGIDISDGVSKHLDVYQDKVFDFVITVCDDAAVLCPIWLREGQMFHVGFDDPALAQGPQEARLAVFRHVRDEIQQQILTFLRSLP